MKCLQLLCLNYSPSSTCTVLSPHVPCLVRPLQATVARRPPWPCRSRCPCCPCPRARSWCPASLRVSARTCWWTWRRFCLGRTWTRTACSPGYRLQVWLQEVELNSVREGGTRRNCNLDSWLQVAVSGWFLVSCLDSQRLSGTAPPTPLHQMALCTTWQNMSLAPFITMGGNFFFLNSSEVWMLHLYRTVERKQQEKLKQKGDFSFSFSF